MKRIVHCRACGSSALTPAFSLDASARRGRDDLLDFALCDPSRDVHACGLLQNARAVEARERRTPPSAAFRTTRSFLRSLATEALELISGRDCAALDIGCSDGTLLSFYPRWVDRYGVDPSDDAEQIGAWAWSAKAAFPSPDLDRAFSGKKFDLITASSVLEEVHEPRAFLARVKALLAADGVFALDTLYAPIALTGTAAESLAGGVAAVYSINVLERTLRDCDLKIFRGALNEKAGGSIRLFITHADSSEYDFDPWYERLAKLWDEENALSLRARAPYQAFEGRAADSRRDFEAAVVDAVARGDKIHLLADGAGARLLYSWAGEGRGGVEAAIAVGEFAEGARLCPGGPPLISDGEARAIEADLIIAPSALKREMLERWREAIFKGAKLMFAAPRPHVVHAGNYAAEFGKSLAGAAGSDGADSLRAILSAAGGLRLVADRSRKSA